MSKASFSSKVKSELCELKFKNDEAVAELASMIIFGENAQSEEVVLKTDRASIAARIQAALKKSIHVDVSIDIIKGKRSYSLTLQKYMLEDAGVFPPDDSVLSSITEFWVCELS